MTREQKDGNSNKKRQVNEIIRVNVWKAEKIKIEEKLK